MKGLNVRKHGFVILLCCTGHIFAQHVCAGIDLVGLIGNSLIGQSQGDPSGSRHYGDLRVIRPSLEVSFLNHFSAGIAYEKGTYSTGYEQINYQDPVQVYKLSGWGVVPDLRFYPFHAPFSNKRSAPLGFFVGTFFQYRKLQEVYTGQDYLLNPHGGSVAPTIYANVNTKAISRAYGLEIGYKVNLSMLTFEFLVGLGSTRGKWTQQTDRDRIDPLYKTDLNELWQGARFQFSLGLMLPPVIKPEAIYNAPSVETGIDSISEYARVIIYRPKKLRGFHNSYKLYANGEYVKTVTNGSYSSVTLLTGETKFRANKELNNTITFKLKKGRTYYLKCSMAWGIFAGQPALYLVSPEKGESEITSLKEASVH